VRLDKVRDRRQRSIRLDGDYTPRRGRFEPSAAREAIDSGTTATNHRQHVRIVVLSKNRFGTKSALASAGAALLFGYAIAVQAGIVPPLSFDPFVSVELGPPDCEEGIDCSEGALDVVAGDFNFDGDLDIATANNASDDVTVLLGDGEGGLSYGTTLSASAGPSGIAAGNLNNDEVIDLVVAKELSPTMIGVFINNGDGTFEDEVEYEMGNSPQAVVLADFDGDTNLDVATTDLFGDTVSVRLGDGNGGFGDRLQTIVPGGPFGMAAGRLDDDENLDLAVSLYDASRLATLIGQGDGTFLFAGTAAAAEVDDAPRGVALADFNDDGDLDAGVATESFDTVDVLLGNGDGTFQDFVPYFVGGVPESVAAGDYNGDGIVDLASADNFGTPDFDGAVSILVGLGDGTFEDAQQFQVDVGPYGIVAADLNDDRLPDIVTANVDNTNVSVLINTGTPPTPTCVGDCDGDGEVSIGELITGVNISLGNQQISVCPAFDANGDGQVGINELIQAVNNALEGCP
jgi:hypothetical protein